MSEPVWPYPSYFGISFYLTLTIAILTLSRVLQVKERKRERNTDEWFGLKLVFSRPEFIVCMKIPSCWPRVLKGNCQAAGAIKETSKHEEFLQGPILVGLQATSRWESGWVTVHTCASILKAQEAVWPAGKEPSTSSPHQIIGWHVAVRSLAWVIVEQGKTHWPGVAEGVQTIGLLQTSTPEVWCADQSHSPWDLLQRRARSLSCHTC